MSSESPLPPRIAERLLSWCLPAGNRGQAILGDLHEDYVRRISSGARRLASDLWYWNQLWRTGLPFLMRRIGRRPLYRTLDGTTEDPAVSSRKGWSMSETASDVRFALRSFSRNPGLAVSATMILGIGIGAITLMFSILNTAVLQPLPYEDPQELIWLWGETETISQNSVSYLDLVDFRDGTDAFEALGGYVVFQQTQFLTGRDQAEQVTATLVTANLFSILGATPELGRSFLAEEEGADAPRVAILGHALWRRRFGGDPAVVGSVISLEDQPVEVVGIMPARFDFPSGSDLWLPIQPTQTYAQGRGNNNFYVVGRLRHGVSFEQAQAQLDVVSANIATAAPNLRAGWGGRMVSLHERFFGDTRAMLLILVGIVSLVPIVASANVASLFLARADARRTEMASRLAVGASRVRLVRQVLTESLLFAVGGGLVGLVLAFGGGQAFRALAPTAVPRLEGLGIDGTVLTFSLLASFLMVPLFGILPALRGTDLSISETLRTGGTRGLSRGRSTFRKGLVVAQVALSLMLLVASGLLVRSYRNLQGQELGFEPENLLYARVALPRYKYDTLSEVWSDWERLSLLLRSSPGVRAIGAVDRPPLSGEGPTNDVWAAERPPSSAADRVDATRRYVAEEFFDVLRIPLLAGRTFVDTDGLEEEEDPPVVVNETLARQFFPGEDPLGKTLVFDYDIIRNLEIVGVVADIKERDPGTDPFPTFYLPARWSPRLNINIFVRTQGDPVDLSAALRQAVQAVDPGIPIPTVQTMEARLADSLFQPRFRSILVSLFALVAVVLSAIGVYGVLACFVRGRTHEIGIRRALGAGTGGTAGLVLWQGGILVGSGILVGFAGAFAGARVLQSWLFGLGAMDPLTCLGVGLLVAMAGLSACLAPTLRALRVDPVEVLKAE